MANTYGALKRVRQTERRTEFNRFAKTRLRHQIRAMRQALAAKTPAAADVRTAMSAPSRWSTGRARSISNAAPRHGTSAACTAASKVVLGEVKK